MKNLLDIIIESNKVGSKKLESSLRVFHWFIIERFFGLCENKGELKAFSDTPKEEYKSLSLVCGEKDCIIVKSSEKVHDGLFALNNEYDYIMVEIKVESKNNEKSENDINKYIKEYEAVITEKKSKYDKLLFIIFDTDSGDVDYFYIGANKRTDRLNLEKENGEKANWKELLQEANEIEFIEYLEENQSIVFRYEEFFTSLLALYIYIESIKDNKEIAVKVSNKNDLRIEVNNVGIEVKYEARDSLSWSNKLKNRGLNKGRQADLFIIDKSGDGYIIEVKKGDTIGDDKGQQKHYKEYCRFISNGKFDSEDNKIQEIYGYKTMNDELLFDSIFLYSKEQTGNKKYELNNMKLFYIFSFESKFKSAFKKFYDKGERTLFGLAKELWGEVIPKEIDIYSD